MGQINDLSPNKSQEFLLLAFFSVELNYMKLKLIIGVVVGILLLIGGLSLISSVIASNTPTSTPKVIAEKDFAKREADEAGTVENNKKIEKPIIPEVENQPEELAIPPIEPITELSTLEQITKAFSDKYGKPVEEITVTITQETENHAKGSVKFGAGGVGEGGLFLATKIDGKWTLIFDGNGSIACQDLAPYNFPQEMIGEICY
jgi:hypothetical protein